MSEQEIKNRYEEDELSLRQIFDVLFDYWREAVSNWKIIALSAIVFSGGLAFTAFLDKDEYQADLTFMLNEDEGGRGAGGLSNLLGQFGFGGGSGKSINLAKIVELASSRKIIQRVLFEKIKVKNEEDFIANHLIRVYDLHDDWEGESLEGFIFTNNDVENFSRRENSAFLKIVKKIHGNKEAKKPGLLTTSADDATGIVTISTQSLSEELSLEISNLVYDKLSKFYIEKSIEKQLATYSVIKAKTDSFYHALNSKQRAYLKFKDTNRSLLLMSSDAKSLELERDIQVLGTAYVEAIRNVEAADFALRTATPFFQIIDDPIYPLKKIQASVLSKFITGILIGVTLALGWILGRKLMRDTIASEEIKA